MAEYISSTKESAKESSTNSKNHRRETVCVKCEKARLKDQEETKRLFTPGIVLTPRCQKCSTECDDNKRHTCPEESFPDFTFPSLYKSKSDQCTCYHMRETRKPKKPTIFVTFSNAGKSHVREVFQLIGDLQSWGFNVKCDTYHHSYNIMTMKLNGTGHMANIFDWIQENFNESRYIVFCLSPLYYEHVKPRRSAGNIGYRFDSKSVEGAVRDTDQAMPSEDHLHSKYIYNQATTEIFNGLCQNRRFLPVLFTNSGASRQHIPAIFKSTPCHTYPDVESLKAFLTY